MVVKMDVQAPAGSSGSAESGTLTLDFSLLDLNEDQEIKAPSGREAVRPAARPARRARGLGGAGSGGSGGWRLRLAARRAEDLQKYSDCVQQAGGDNAKVAKCADLLSP